MGSDPRFKVQKGTGSLITDPQKKEKKFGFLILFTYNADVGKCMLLSKTIKKKFNTITFYLRVDLSL
jgi:hypothetical protein